MGTRINFLHYREIEGEKRTPSWGIEIIIRGLSPYCPQMQMSSKIIYSQRWSFVMSDLNVRSLFEDERLTIMCPRTSLVLQTQPSLDHPHLFRHK